MIAAVDLKVSEYEKNQKWLEILNKIENKTYTKLKNGHVFRKQALISKERTLLHDGLVYWKTATGRFKGIVSPPLTYVTLLTGQIFKRRVVQRWQAHTQTLGKWESIKSWTSIGKCYISLVGVCCPKQKPSSTFYEFAVWDIGMKGAEISANCWHGNITLANVVC